MSIIKIKIAKFLIISGVLFYTGNYVVELFNFYHGDGGAMVFIADDTEEKPESKEKDSSEKEDFNEKDKISQYTDDRNTRISILVLKDFPEINCIKSSVYLKFTTPPPEFS